jgi:type II secretory pathway component PulJ
VNRSPAPSLLARAVCQGLTGAPASGFSLIEVMLSLGGLALLSGAAFIIYDGAANNADVRTE